MLTNLRTPHWKSLNEQVPSGAETFFDCATTSSMCCLYCICKNCDGESGHPERGRGIDSALYKGDHIVPDVEFIIYMVYTSECGQNVATQRVTRLVSGTDCHRPRQPHLRDAACTTNETCSLPASDFGLAQGAGVIYIHA